MHRRTGHPLGWEVSEIPLWAGDGGPQTGGGIALLCSDSVTSEWRPKPGFSLAGPTHLKI